MPLTSKLFKEEAKLQNCLINDRDHVVPGARGSHVGKIQKALIQLGGAVISPSEIAASLYGESTARAVLRFKGPPRNIINTKYQKTPDNIVGKMTIEALDREIKKFEPPVSFLVSVDEDGAPHDHSTCPRLEAGEHLGTPINPQRFGRMINIFGDHETDYLGFEDFATDRAFISRNEGGPRKVTFDPISRGGLGNAVASDICMRSSPVFDFTADEIKRIALPRCRLTYAGSSDNIQQFGPRILRLGTLIETVRINSPSRFEPGGTFVPESTFTIFVLRLA